MRLLSRVYGRVVTLRRAWYAQRPGARQRLPRPVISIGNLVVGGSGKTPATAAIARLLLEGGERPVILSRGYGRRSPSREVVVVSDRTRVLEPVDRSGDEPQMLARALPGVPVVVSARRFRAGLEAVRRFDPTVFVLDDGFQHVQLARDLDLLLVAPADVDDRVLPAGRLREPIEAAQRADALLVAAATADADRIAARLGVRPVFRLTNEAQPPVRLGRGTLQLPGGTRVVAVAGIARPERFFATLRGQGWTVVREMPFRDHHWFTARDRARIDEAARAGSAAAILTTEKDAVRLQETPAGVPWGYVPITAAIEPAADFASWLTTRLAAIRAPATREPAPAPHPQEDGR